MTDGFSEAECLGCRKKFKVPHALFRMAETYEDGRPVLFCGRACNLKFVAKLGLEGQERQMRELLDRLEKP